MKAKERAKLVEMAIRIAWASLESHFYWTQEGRPTRASGDTRFHKRAVQEYATLIAILSKLY